MGLIIFHIAGQHHENAVLSAIPVIGVLEPMQLAQVAGTGISRLIVPVALNTHQRLGMGRGIGGIKNGHAHMEFGRRTWIGGGINRAGELQGDVGRGCPVRIVIRCRDPDTGQQVGIVAKHHVTGLGLQVGRAVNNDGGSAFEGIMGNLGKRADADAVIDARVADRVDVVRPRPAAEGRHNPVRIHHADGAGQFAVQVLLHLPGVGGRIIGELVLVDRLGDHHGDRVDRSQHEHADDHGDHHLHQGHAW